MDDDVLELTRKCAEAMGFHLVYADDSLPLAVEREGIGAQNYHPAKSDAQAFELLCWLAERGDVHIYNAIFHYRQWGSAHSIEDDTKIDTPAELRLAIMRAVCKVKEGS